ncbi:membrane-bound PQQ-dependent dehydrogenase, glucose/quinate/shikimate family [Psychromarinibacter halotolerans]|uniref:Membrane-bound PQQ-dependent dehydrogenase, glucose/quinate/shikimate family n=1 Tax=Psychromarinibacter halotolerans TaxID=1775175 RepID=A0ABV7GZ25_9RHOB|nr:membrane-bound PQQ-dependent dehydrogenase, glucose/quinate/shikimate family [Psychromarinibacter halotolerans]MDF0598382.1 membrane-bound PQQ-dependent dehydrogenase, glucose/quinate/shikimate family [Psychromarinibacter halotolerans]
MLDQPIDKPWKKVSLLILGLILTATGLALLGGGLRLLMLGGSIYFAPAGLALTVSGVLTILRKPAGALLYLATFVVTVLWALSTSAFALWPLISDLMAPAVLAVAVLLLMPAYKFKPGRSYKAPRIAAGVLTLGIIATFVGAFQTQWIVKPQDNPDLASGAGVSAPADENWAVWGGNAEGTRFSSLTQLTPENVAQLEPAWTYRTGEVPVGGEGHIVVPLQVDGMLYGCTHTSRLFAVDSETGEEIWTFDPDAEGNIFPRCRGVIYYDANADQSPAERDGDVEALDVDALCSRRIISSTVDARLVAVDALTGEPCAEFGENGIFDLRNGMGEIKTGYYFQTSSPTVGRGLIVIGGWVHDNAEVGEPSGVIRAFDARTAELVWAWDLGDPSITLLPPPGESYSRGTPNVWSTMSYDDTLGLVYLPVGNATPDFWGGHRSDAANEYSSSIVALNIETGREAWHFQTTHHDLWDYDVASQPVLYDAPDGNGGTIPAVYQPTKRGHIFALNRETGEPIVPVEERPVPTDGVDNETYSPTQPYSTFPSFGTEELSENRMWGATLLDQLYCRVRFKGARYEGDFTPLTTDPTIIYPGWSGGMNWGSVSINEDEGIMIVNDIRLPIISRLIERETYDEMAESGDTHGGAAAMAGTPYGLQQDRFMSPLGIPCQEPPFGTLSAVNLNTNDVLWSKPLGTIKDAGPLGIATGINIPIGLPTLGGSVNTASGLVFMAGTQDYYIRALDVHTGEELWKGRLPVGGETSPMTYVSPESGRQFVVITVGGNRATPIRGDYIMAFALPE